MRSENKPKPPSELSFIEKARRAQLIACTIETIAALGYGQASLAQIAKQAGVSKGVISYHFTSKDALIEQVAVEIFRTWGTFMGAQVEAEPTARGKLRAYIASSLSFMTIHRQHLTALLEILFNARPTPAPLAEAHRHSLCDLERLLIWGQETGEFGAFSPQVMALVIRNAIDIAPGKLTSEQDFDLGTFTVELTALFDRATRA